MTHRINLDIFRNNLKNIRKWKDLSSKDLSVLAGLRQHKRIADIEEGRGAPSLEEMYSICETLEQSMDDMIKKEINLTINFI